MSNNAFNYNPISHNEIYHTASDRIDTTNSEVIKPLVDMADPNITRIFKQQDTSFNSPSSRSDHLLFDDPFKSLETAWEKGMFKNGTLNVSETIGPDSFSFNFNFKQSDNNITKTVAPVQGENQITTNGPAQATKTNSDTHLTDAHPTDTHQSAPKSAARLAGYVVHFGQYGAGYGDPISTVDKLAKDGVNMIRDDYSHNNKAEEQAFVRAVKDGMHPLLIVQNVQAIKNAIDEYKNLKNPDGSSVLANINFEYRNEPDPRTTNPATYAAEATTASKMLKAASPTSQFIIGAQAYGGTVQGANDFIEKVARDMNYQNFDAVSIHPYGDAWHMTPQTIANKISAFEKQIDAQAGHRITVDVSENGWTQSEDPNGTQAAELINLLAKDPNIGMYGAYELNKDAVDKNKWAIAGTNAYEPITRAEAKFINTP